MILRNSIGSDPLIGGPLQLCALGHGEHSLCMLLRETLRKRKKHRERERERERECERVIPR